MEYEELKIDRSIVRDEIFALLKISSSLSYTKRLGFTARSLHDLTKRERELQAFIADVYKRLDVSGKILKVRHIVSESRIQRSENAYFQLYVQGIIFEEVMALVRDGVIMLARIHPDEMSWTGRFTVDPNHILVTEYGSKILAEHNAIPYFADEYIKLLAQTSEPDDELKGYLTEGLACLQNNLPRAAILLLRLTCEHLIQKLIDAIEHKMPDEAKKKAFLSKKGITTKNLNERMNTVFDQLEKDNLLLATNTHLKGRLNNELKPTFHSIREFAGNAAHRNIAVGKHQVRDFYIMFSSITYPVTMKIIEDLQS